MLDSSNVKSDEEEITCRDIYADLHNYISSDKPKNYLARSVMLFGAAVLVG